MTVTVIVTGTENVKGKLEVLHSCRIVKHGDGTSRGRQESVKTVDRQSENVKRAGILTASDSYVPSSVGKHESLIPGKEPPKPGMRLFV